MKYAVAQKLLKLNPPYTKEAKLIFENAGEHTCLCRHEAGATGGLVLPNRVIVTPCCHRETIVVEYSNGSSSLADLTKVHEGFGFYETHIDHNVGGIGHDHTSVGALLFANIFGWTFVYEKLPPKKVCRNTLHIPIYGVPLFTRAGSVAGIVTHKPRRHEVAFLTDFPLP